MMKPLKQEQLSETYTWLDQFQLPINNRNINRSFADCVLLAELLKQLYPKYVDMHNYPARNSSTLKLDNWQTLNRKVLRKLRIAQPVEVLEKASKGVPGAVEHILYQVMIRSNYDLQRNAKDADATSTDDANNDGQDDETIITVNVNKFVGDALVKVPQKMILYSLYEQAREELAEKDRIIAGLTQKVAHLESFLKLKSERIESLCQQLTQCVPAKNYSYLSGGEMH